MLKHNDIHTRTYKQANLAKLTCFFFNKAPDWNVCPFRWNEEETPGTCKRFSTLGDITEMWVATLVSWCGWIHKSLTDKGQGAVSRTFTTVRSCGLSRSFDYVSWPALVPSQWPNFHQDLSPVELVTLSLLAWANFIHVRPFPCSFIQVGSATRYWFTQELATYPPTPVALSGRVHPWGDKGYFLKTCRVKVFT